jgi:hypothetical protein
MPLVPHPDDPARLLRLALRANAAFSTTCALLFVIDGAALAPLIGVPYALLVALGLALLGFAALLTASSLRDDRARLLAEASLYCAADLAWVVGSLPILALGWLSPTGAIGLAGVSAVVLALAIAQAIGIGRARLAAA